MNEYISREETVKAFCEKCKGYYDGHCIHRGECDIDIIKNAPAADVQPVKHGRWEQEDILPKLWRVCSCCGYTARRNYKKYQYCPNCGARMDEETQP